MKRSRILLVLCLVLALLLSGCGQRKLDAEIQALAEASDAGCWVRAAEKTFVPVPEGLEGNWQTTSNGEHWGNLMECMLMEDFFGNLTPDSMPNRVFVLLDRDQYSLMLYSPQKKRKNCFLYLDLIPGYSRRAMNWEGAEEEYPVFTVRSIRWETLDRECLRRMEALRAYGKAHPRELIDHAAQ